MRLLTFSGVLLDSGELQLEPGFVVEAEPPKTDGELTVEALSRGRAIAATRLPLERPCGKPASPPATEHPPRVAIGLVEFPERATGLRVIHDGQTLLERTAPRPAGDPEVTWPDALEGDAVSLSWRSPQRESLASLGYSNDVGETWTPLSLPTAEETISFDASMLPGGDRCLLELAVTDGFRTARLRSKDYEVEAKGWVLWILSPGPGAALSAAEPVLLAAQAYQLEERRPGFDEIVWRSSLDGGLGAGAQLLAALRAGDHTVVAEGFGASAEVRVSVA